MEKYLVGHIKQAPPPQFSSMCGLRLSACETHAVSLCAHPCRAVIPSRAQATGDVTARIMMLLFIILCLAHT